MQAIYRYILASCTKEVIIFIYCYFLVYLSLYLYVRDYMGHRTKRILRIERKEYQTY